MDKAISSKCSEVRNECLKPYESFKSAAYRLKKIINEPIAFLDSQVKEFEEKQRLERVAFIKDMYNSLIGDLSDNISFEQISDAKWENASVSKKAVKDEMTTKINEIRQNVSVIKSTLSDKTEEALQMYYENLNLATAIAFINRYEQQKREIQARMEEQQRCEKERELETERERIRREERAKIAQEEQIKADAYKKAQEEQKAKEQAEIEAMAVQKQVNASTINTVTYSISATPDELEQIEMYLSSIGVDFERVI
jgi:C4-dicarboxylate-specific signal transduction histidine kinase